MSDGKVNGGPAYGYCPHCGAVGLVREYEGDICVNGHIYPSIDARSEPPAPPADWMGTQMIMALRDVERRFEGVCVTIFVSAPGARNGSPQFSQASTAHPDDLAAVLRSWLLENKK